MSEHTKGPWKWEVNSGTEDYDRLLANDGSTVFAFSILCGRYLKPADARLIAASPDMEEALRGFVKWYEEQTSKATDKLSVDVGELNDHYCDFCFVLNTDLDGKEVKR